MRTVRNGVGVCIYVFMCLVGQESLSHLIDKKPKAQKRKVS